MTPHTIFTEAKKLRMIPLETQAREKFAELFTAVAAINTPEDLDKLCFVGKGAFPSHLWTQAGPCGRCGQLFPKLL